MSAKTTHIIPKDDGWVVKKDRSHTLRGQTDTSGDAPTPSAVRAITVYATQREAIEAARKLARRSVAWQIILHGRNGSMRRLEMHGLPVVQRSMVKSDLGREAIKRAVSAVIRKRLEGA
jgi:hypothetical protein